MNKVNSSYSILGPPTLEVERPLKSKTSDPSKQTKLKGPFAGTLVCMSCIVHLRGGLKCIASIILF